MGDPVGFLAKNKGDDVVHFVFHPSPVYTAGTIRLTFTASRRSIRSFLNSTDLIYYLFVYITETQLILSLALCANSLNRNGLSPPEKCDRHILFECHLMFDLFS